MWPPVLKPEVFQDFVLVEKTCEARISEAGFELAGFDEKGNSLTGGAAAAGIELTLHNDPDSMATQLYYR